MKKTQKHKPQTPRNTKPLSEMLRGSERASKRLEALARSLCRADRTNAAHDALRRRELAIAAPATCREVDLEP